MSKDLNGLVSINTLKECRVPTNAIILSAVSLNLTELLSSISNTNFMVIFISFGKVFAGMKLHVQE